LLAHWLAPLGAFKGPSLRFPLKKLIFKIEALTKPPRNP
jgi:hypothetical protein